MGVPNFPRINIQKGILMIWDKALEFSPKNFCTDPACGVTEGPFKAHEHFSMVDPNDPDHMITGIRTFDAVSSVAILPRTPTRPGDKRVN